MPVLLDNTLLDRFESALRDIGARVVDHLAPGLDDARIDELLVPRDIDLPEEARVWWRWHNGVLPDAPPEARWITPGRDLCSLEAASHEYEQVRLMLLDSYGVVKVLRPVSDAPMIYLDCGVPQNASVPVLSLIDWTEQPTLALRSFGELIEMWIEYVDRGVFRTNPDGTWVCDHESIPRDIVDLGVY